MKGTHISSDDEPSPTTEGEPPGGEPSRQTITLTDPRDSVSSNYIDEDSSASFPAYFYINLERHKIRNGFNTRSREFQKRHFSWSTAAEWNDWRWHICNRITSLEKLSEIISLTEEEKEAIRLKSACKPVGITPYYASLIDADDPGHPLRKMMIPVTAETIASPGEAEDPLGEEHDSAAPGLVHRYPDRCLLLTTDSCASYCRYCTRSRMVGLSTLKASKERWEKAIGYIEATPAIRDVLLSGGDPLTLPDEALEWILGKLKRISHIEILRIGTKAPVVLPQRITPALVRMLKRYHPLWMSIHFSHPLELTPEVSQACGRLADAGIPLGSQTVLLAGINDDVATMKALFQGLMTIRVRPYYLYQCDPIIGSAHFRTPVSQGLDIIRGLRGHTSGYAVPTFVIDAPGGGGKVPLMPDYILGRQDDDLILANFEDKTFRYPDPVGAVPNPPSTAQEATPFTKHGGDRL